LRSRLHFFGRFSAKQSGTGGFRRTVRRVRRETESRWLYSWILNLVWRKRIGCRQCFSGGCQRQHVPGRPDQFAESAAGGADRGSEQWRKRGMAGAPGSQRSPAADSFGGIGNAVLRERE